MNSKRTIVSVLATVAALVLTGSAPATPIPTGSSTTTVSYPVGGVQQNFSGVFDYNGVSPGNALPVGAAPNIRAFNSGADQSTVFGRRSVVDGFGIVNPGQPNEIRFTDALGPGEALVSHAFFKQNIMQNYFPGIDQGGNITVNIQGIQFDEPATVLQDTVLLHVLFNDSQNVQLGTPYFQTHNHFTTANPFRDFDLFSSNPANVFGPFPVPNFVLDEPTLDVQFTGEGTDTLDVSFTFPYELLRNLEENGQPLPTGLPGTDFLEPFHFHLEYVVVPEPATAILFAPAAAMLYMRRRRRMLGS